ncbi:MAG: right-handed parallel beta-helix repeat-containing protein [Methanotrichaceae archaeon]|nr:right-handed parallel beta-helix repeat-containing protein [Methanotrichaceae archaeon]
MSRQMDRRTALAAFPSANRCFSSPWSCNRCAKTLDWPRLAGSKGRRILPLMSRVALALLFLLAAANPCAGLVTVPVDVPTIQEAIDGACPCSTIEVESGVYRENVVVDRPVILKGVDSGGGNPIIDAGGWVSGISIISDGVTVSGFIITNSNLGSGIEVKSSCNTIYNNTITKNALNGMKFVGNLSENIVLWNTIGENGFSGIVFKDEAQKSTIAGNNIEGNGFSGLNFAGRADENLVLMNEVIDNGFVGIQFQEFAEENIVSANYVEGNAFGGIDVSGGSQGNLISDNCIMKNTFTGLSLSNGTSGNLMVANCLLFNLEHDAYDLGIENCWDDGTIGNYYSSCDCVDENRDGICDDPFPIDGGSAMDHYPLAAPGATYIPWEDLVILGDPRFGDA